ncbi:AsmA family protein [Sphingobium sp. H39-3-25]|uniref:AsmA family protein n=1 Tax=Sphingobium arseniciresistens TaxID=3030834 RepID=UPI0023B8ACE4|nr:AsmA family protein [Sphingobium arseniciresistens]
METAPPKLSPRQRPFQVAATFRRLHPLAKIGVTALIAIFAAWIILFVTKGRFLKGPFERTVTALTERKTAVKGDFQLYFAPFSIKFHAQGLTLANPAWAQRRSLFTARQVDARIAPLSLLFGKRRFYSLVLNDAAIDLEWNRAHDANSWTFGSGKGGKPLALPRIDRASVAGTRLHYLDPRMRLLADLEFDTINSVDARIGKTVGVKGTGRIRDTPFRMIAQLYSPDATANRGRNKLSLRAWAGANLIDVKGSLPSVADIENVPLQTQVSGRDLSDLLAIIGVAIPQTRTYRLKGQLVKDGEIYRFTDLSGTFGNSDVAGRLTITNGNRVRLESELNTRRLDIIEAAPFIGYNPDIVAAKGATAAAAATGAAPNRILPDAAIPVKTMQAFDAALKWKIGIVRSRNVPVSDIDLSLALDKGRLALSPLTFSMARGKVAADIILDARHHPAAVSYDIRLAPTPLAKLLAGYGVAEAGTSGTIHGRIKLEGRGDTVHDSLASATGRIAFIIPQGSFWTRNVQLSELDLGTFAYKMFQGRLKEPVQINCGLIAFTVRNGFGSADPILIDTRKNVISGRGGFSFSTEALDIGVRADGKKFSLFSGQSPVGIGGRFGAPSLNVISPELLGRSGAGLGLAMLVSPPAAVLAFVDVGNAKAAACGPVLVGAGAAAQRTKGGKPRDDVAPKRR